MCDICAIQGAIIYVSVHEIPPSSQGQAVCQCRLTPNEMRITMNAWYSSQIYGPNQPLMELVMGHQKCIKMLQEHGEGRVWDPMRARRRDMDAAVERN